MAPPGEDRISVLPDDLLFLILALLPLACAVRTSALARRWRSLWQHRLRSSTSFDFAGDHPLCHLQLPHLAAATLHRYFHLHGDLPLRSFALSFTPAASFAPDVRAWLRAALRKGVRDLHLDFSGGIADGDDPTEKPFLLRSKIFRRSLRRLKHLTLRYCRIRRPLDVAGLAMLQSLSLDRVDITDKMLEKLLSRCRFLESLSLRRCHKLKDVYIGKPRGDDLRLREFLLVDCNESFVEMSAPQLQTFVFCGLIGLPVNLCDVPAIEDVYCYLFDEPVVRKTKFAHTVPEHGLVELLYEFQDVKILTLCSTGLMHAVSENEDELFQDMLELQEDILNLQELQLLMKSFGQEQIGHIFRFFRRFSCPVTERLFIKLPENPSATCSLLEAPEEADDLQDITFTHLRLIKIYNFRGSECELMLVRLLVQRAPVLELLVLVLAAGCAPQGFASELAVLPKASLQAQIMLCGSDGSEVGAKPKHQRHYHEEK